MNKIKKIKVVWEIRKFVGEVEHVLRTKIGLQSTANSYYARKEIGPIWYDFNYSLKFYIKIKLLLNFQKLKVSILKFLCIMFQMCKLNI